MYIKCVDCRGTGYTNYYSENYDTCQVCDGYMYIKIIKTDKKYFGKDEIYVYRKGNYIKKGTK